MKANFSVILMLTLLWLALGSTAITHASETPILEDSSPAAVRSLVATYSHYANTIKLHGIDGLKEFALPNLAVRLGGKTYQGKKAFSRLDQFLSGLQSGKFVVDIQQITINGNTAVALTQETLGWRENGQGMTSMKWYLKQTWHKTPQGWKLAASDQRMPKIKATPVAATYTYTVGS